MTSPRPPASLGHMSLVCETRMAPTSSYLGLCCGLWGSKKNTVESGLVPTEPLAWVSSLQDASPIIAQSPMGGMSDSGSRTACVWHSDIVAGLILCQKGECGQQKGSHARQETFLQRPSESGRVLSLTSAQTSV